MIGWIATLALGGYGDGGNGFPTVEERQMQIWANAARLAPADFEADYLLGGCSYFVDFLPAEQVPQVPYRYDAGLAEASSLHANDMFANAFYGFDSSDGTLWSDRIRSFYTSGGAIAINIGQTNAIDPPARSMVLETWMCSSSGRAAIMGSLYEDIGMGLDGVSLDWKATMNLGEGQGGVFPPMTGGSHEPTVPANTVDFYADWNDVAAPDGFQVVLDGIGYPMTLGHGVAEAGLYTSNVTVPPGTCHAYHFDAILGGTTTRFPETGSYSFGTCAGADPATGWMPMQMGPLGNSVGVLPIGAPGFITVTGAIPGEEVKFVRGTSQGQGACLPPLGGACLGVTGNTGLLGSAFADGTGTAQLMVVIPLVVPPGTTVYAQGLASDGLGNWFGTPVDSTTVF